MQIAATQFKVKCLRLIKEVHGRKRNSMIITKRGKPYARLSAIDEDRAPLYGCLRGLAKTRGDLTAPTGADGEALHAR